MKIYKMVIRAILTYATETTTLMNRKELRMRAAEREIKRRILGPTRWRMQNEDEFGDREGVKMKKYYRIEMYGVNKRRIGGLRLMWIQEMKDDSRKIEVRNSENEARNRKTWHNICREMGRL